MANDLRIFGGNFDDVNALRVTAQAGGQLLYVTGEGSSALLLQNKSVTPGASAQTVRPDEGYYGLSQVNVDAIPSSYIIPANTYNITANGLYNIARYASVQVNVPMVHNNQNKTAFPSIQRQTILPDSGYDGLAQVIIEPYTLQNKNVTPTKSSQTITMDSGYTGLNSVVVNSIPEQYILTTDATASSTDIIAGHTAYVDTVKITGTMTVRNVYEGNSAPTSAVGSVGDIYFLME